MKERNSHRYENDMHLIYSVCDDRKHHKSLMLITYDFVFDFVSNKLTDYVKNVHTVYFIT